VSISGSIERRLSVCSSAPAPLMAVRKSCARNRAAIAKAESPGEGPSELLRRPPITINQNRPRAPRVSLQYRQAVPYASATARRAPIVRAASL